MKPPKREFEQVVVDEWIKAEIVDVQYEKDREFTHKGNKSTSDAARIIFRLEGYKDQKPTQWMRFNYAQKSNLFNMFLLPLVPGATPNMDFDLDNLKGMNVKVMYAQKGEYQNLFGVRPLGAVSKKMPPLDVAETHEDQNDEQVPF